MTEYRFLGEPTVGVIKEGAIAKIVMWYSENNRFRGFELFDQSNNLMYKPSEKDYRESPHDCKAYRLQPNERILGFRSHSNSDHSYHFDM